jgi:hypothetical protein
MMWACVFPAVLASGLVGPSLALALAAAPEQSVPDQSAPTALEQALGERACAGAQSAGSAGYDLHGVCLGAQLLALRTDFGRDLTRLSTSERKKLDSACSRLQTTQGREAYLDCLQAQLASLPVRRNRVNLPVPADAGVAAVLVGASSNAVPSTALPSSSMSSRALGWAGALLVTVVGAAGIGLFVLRARRARHTCRVCAVRVPKSSDLCPTCRHDAAEALRKAANDRTEQQRAHEEEQRRQREQAEDQHQQAVRAEEEARLYRLQEARGREEAAQREELRQREEDAERRQSAETEGTQAGVGDNAESTLNPYVVLGLAQGASAEEVRAAFEAARARYDPEQVSHLGNDAQELYAAKLLAAECAYQLIAGEIDAPSPTIP